VSVIRASFVQVLEYFERESERAPMSVILDRVERAALGERLYVRVSPLFSTDVSPDTVGGR